MMQNIKMIWKRNAKEGGAKRGARTWPFARAIQTGYCFYSSLLKAVRRRANQGGREKRRGTEREVGSEGRGKGEVGEHAIATVRCWPRQASGIDESASGYGGSAWRTLDAVPLSGLGLALAHTRLLPAKANHAVRARECVQDSPPMAE